jgi:hypothetical protein
MTALEIYLFVAPLLVLAVGLAAYGMAVVGDRRARRRRAQEDMT